MEKWNLLKAVVIVTTLLSFTFPSLGSSPNSGMKEVKKTTYDMLVDGLHEINSVSTKKEKGIINKINIGVWQNRNPDIVRAFKTAKGQRHIQVSTGYSTVTFMITFAHHMEAALDINNFGEEYTRYVTENYAKNSITHVNQSAWDYAGLSGNNSPWNDKKFVATVYGNHALVLWYVLAHEIAHHVLGHIENPSISLEENRKREQEADDWASKTLIKLGLPPAAAFPALMYWYYMDEFGVENEYQKSHPADLKRIRKMLQYTIDNVDSWNGHSPYFPKVDTKQATNAYKRLLYHVEDLISQQTDFKDDSSKKFEICMEVMFEGCVTACINKYNQPKDKCKDELCTSTKQENVAKLRCEEMLVAN
ncbi:M48 family metalloprotease [Photobacterium alginatilyticum]|uniref:Peptidase M48 domain-containing protein n=1 Tax=Photobacterium alginatilyticum TaxID=1775171 RepID=A0ABW9YDJ0_9GAMM|nr:hypothetical protein [Photobacterium alginatilyticum]NBI51832.1 hypothetical protein [Photobacterium alginatilyticum]